MAVGPNGAIPFGFTGASGSGSSGPPAPPFAPSSADNGISISTVGGFIELGNASVLSALAAFTTDRFIPMNGFKLQFSSSNISAPDNMIEIFSAGAIALTRGVVTGAKPVLTLSDTAITGSQLSMSSNTLTLSGTATALANLSVTGQSAGINLMGNGAGSAALSVSRSGSPSFVTIQEDFVTVTSDGANSAFVANITQAAGAIAFQAHNANTGASSSVLSKWYVDSTSDQFQLIKYSNANSGANPGGVDLQSANTNISAAALRLIILNTGGTIQHLISTSIYLRQSTTLYEFGDISVAGNGTRIVINDSTPAITFTSAVTTGVTTSSGIVYNASALTSGTAAYIASATITSGNLLNLVTTGTAAAAGNEALNIDRSGANASNAITVTGARISVTNTNATSGTNVGLDVTASGATTDNIAIQATGKVNISGNLTLTTAGNRFNITEGSNAIVGQTTLSSGTKAITISGLTTSSRAFITLVTPSGVTLTTSYQAVCTANTLTIQANVAAGTINTADASVINYLVIN